LKPALGDFNLDSHVDAADIPAMEQALANLPAYQTAKGLSDAQLLAIGDINNDGVVNNADLQALLDLLNRGGGSSNSVPEPASLALLGLGALAIVIRRRIRQTDAIAIYVWSTSVPRPSQTTGDRFGMVLLSDQSHGKCY